jgi:hypothetical protein
MGERLLDQAARPTPETIAQLLGTDAMERLKRLEVSLRSDYDLNVSLEFPFGSSYGWGYKYSHKAQMLCYAFFERDSFTVTVSLGKAALPRLNANLSSLLPKTQKLWEERYPCGEGGWVHYPVCSDGELEDVLTLIRCRRSPAKKAGKK